MVYNGVLIVPLVSLGAQNSPTYHWISLGRLFVALLPSLQTITTSPPSWLSLTLSVLHEVLLCSTGCIDALRLFSGELPSSFTHDADQRSICFLIAYLMTMASFYVVWTVQPATIPKDWVFCPVTTPNSSCQADQCQPPLCLLLNHHSHSLHSLCDVYVSLQRPDASTRCH